jgi:AcrR family transcriptional regulator
MTTPRYHHGNLRSALLEAGLRIAADAGPAALQVRDLAKAEQVSASAVYRHFPDLAHLSAEVARLARQQLAQAMLDAAEAESPGPDAGWHAIRRFDAIGRAYVAFAVRSPRLFDTAFQTPQAPPSCDDSPSAWTVLTDALDALVASGELAADLRPGAPMVAWAAVHGLASILVRQMVPEPAEERAAVDAVMRGVKRALGLRLA